jgi:putative ABC transport system substrate-binding protein
MARRSAISCLCEPGPQGQGLGHVIQPRRGQLHHSFTAHAGHRPPQVQAITITSDNTSSARIEDLAGVCNDYQLPLFAGDIDSIERGAVAAYGLNYFLVGYAAGRKAALILRGVNPAELEWTRIEKYSLALNLKAAQRQGVSLSETVQARAHRLIR